MAASDEILRHCTSYQKGLSMFGKPGKFVDLSLILIQRYIVNNVRKNVIQIQNFTISLQNIMIQWFIST